MGDGFYRSKDPTNSIKVLKEMLQRKKNINNADNIRSVVTLVFYYRLYQNILYNQNPECAMTQCYLCPLISNRSAHMRIHHSIYSSAVTQHDKMENIKIYAEKLMNSRLSLPHVIKVGAKTKNKLVSGKCILGPVQ